MKSKALEFTLLNHLFYYTEVSGGSASATLTGAFLGDLALNYALNRNLVADENYYERCFRKKPQYEEIKDFGFYCSVGKPLTNRCPRTENYIRNTLFNTDGFIDVDSIQKSGKSPFKNFRQAQGLQIGTTFQALLLYKDEITIPPTLRLGTGRETLLEVSVKEKEATEYWLNAFTLKTVFGNLNKATKLMLREKKPNFTYILENYNLIKRLSAEEIQEVFEGIF
jgi:CRISPR-associated protein Csc1